MIARTQARIAPLIMPTKRLHHNFAISRFDNPFERLLVSLPTLNRFGQTRSLGASAPRDLSFAYSGILIPMV
jgi:hypothetical protein